MANGLERTTPKPIALRAGEDPLETLFTPKVAPKVTPPELSLEEKLRRAGPGVIGIEEGIPAGLEAEQYRIEHGLISAKTTGQKDIRRQYLISQARKHGVPQGVLANQIALEKLDERVEPKRVLKKDVAGVLRDVTTGERIFEGVEKPKKESKISAKTSYLPVADNKFQLMSVPTAGGEATPVLRDGKPVVLTEKQVLISEGKKAQSLINPYETKFLGKLGESESKRITELKTKAVDSVASKEIIGEARVLLDQGIYTGTAANIRKNFDKLLQEANIFIGGRKAANTEAYASMMGLQVGKIIKQFGAGTGLSDADREYAEKIVGGRVTLTEDAIRRLLDINERLADFTISEYNSQAARAKRDIEEKDYLRPIVVPEPSPRTGGTISVPDMSTMSIEELTAIAQGR